MSNSLDWDIANYARHGGAIYVRRMPDGLHIGVVPMLTTYALLVGLTTNPLHWYEVRYCYDRLQDALDAASTWTGEGDPGGPWVKKKGLNVDQLGPGVTA